MFRLSFALLLLLSLIGCQSPIVSTRSFSFDTTVVANGKEYRATKDYMCHFEDLTVFSSRGKDWHIRDGVRSVRAVGLLDDGSRYHVIPQGASPDHRFCAGQSERTEVRVFIELDQSKVESFDYSRSEGLKHQVKVVNSSITNPRGGYGAFVEQANWPKSTHSLRRYYSIYAAIYVRTDWQRKPEIDNMIRSKRIAWLEDGKVYPFTSWSADDMAFARLRQFDSRIDGVRDSAPRLPLKMSGDEWSMSGEADRAVQWRLDTAANDLPGQKGTTPSSIPRTWVVVGTSRIEVPLRTYYRTFYQPELDRLLEFRVEHVELW